MSKILSTFNKLSLLFFCISFFSFGISPVDSLVLFNKTSKNEKLKVENYNKIALAYSDKDAIKSYFYAKKALELSQSIRFEEGKAMGLIVMGQSLDYQGKVVESVQLLEEGLKIARNSKNDKLISKAQQALFYVFLRDKRLSDAKNYLLAKIETDKRLVADPINAARNLDLMGLVSEEEGNLDTAYVYYKLAAELAQKEKDTASWATYTNNMAIVHGLKGKNDSALVYHKQALALYSVLQSHSFQVGFVKFWIAKTYLNLNQNDSAFIYAHDGWRLNKNGGPHNSVQFGSELLYKIYKKKKQYDSSLVYYEKYVAETEMISASEKEKAITGIENKYQLERKNEELKFKEQELTYKNRLIYAFVVLLLLVIVVASVLYNQTRVKNKLNAILSDQKKELHEQNQEIEAQNEEISAMNKNLEDVIETRTRQLLENEYLLSMSQSLAKLGSWILDLKTWKFKWSSEVYRLFETDEDAELDFDNLPNLIGEENVQLIRTKIFEAVNHSHSMEYEFELKDRNGFVKYLYLFAIPEFDIETNNVSKIKGCIQDISERKLNEIRIINQTNELIESNKKAADYKLMALRSVMNPHFLFNSLNSIQYFIAKNIKEKAIDYLSQFSKLMRLILNSSFENTITLAQEIEMLRFYVNLEALRFNKFKTNISIETGLDIDYIEVPSLLFQPFVENAILHGLSHLSNNEGLLEISFKRNNNSLICIIEDNGIGRPAANALKKGENRLHRSLGMHVTAERLRMVNDNEFVAIHIVDKMDVSGNSQGTKVEISLEID